MSPGEYVRVCRRRLRAGRAHAREFVAHARASPTFDAALLSSREVPALFDAINARIDNDARLPTVKLFDLPDDRLEIELWRRLSAKGDTQPLSRGERAIVCPMNLSAEVNDDEYCKEQDASAAVAKFARQHQAEITR